MKKVLILCSLMLGVGLHAQTPAVATVTNSGSLSPLVSPGAVVSIHGSRFGNSLAGTRVTVGGLDAAVLFVSDRQINVQFPFELPVGSTTLRVTVEGKVSEAVGVTISPYAPAVLTVDGSGRGRGVFTNEQGLVSPVSAAAPGESLAAYMVGLGPTRFHVPHGTVTPSDPVPVTTAIPTVTVGGVPAAVESARLSPGLVGVYEVDFVVPHIDFGDHDVVISIGGMDSPAVTLPVGPNPGPVAMLRDTNGTARIIGTAPPRRVNPERSPATPLSAIATVQNQSLFNGGNPIISGVSAIRGQQIDLFAYSATAGKDTASSLPVLLSPASLPAGTNPGSGPTAVTTAAGTGVVYTCDATINAVSGVCAFLNGTIAGLYSSAFTNANASIYITFGSTSLGQSETELNLFSTYTNFRNALIATETSANDMTAINDSVPATEPTIFGSDSVVVTNASLRALGGTPTGGLTSAGAFCTIGTAGCYDSIITISSGEQAAGNLYFRTGTIGSNQYDFYSVVEHETDEVLGTSSCAWGCAFNSANYIAPPDLFRYHSNGTRTFSTAGTNSSCSASSTTNACLSLDGVHMLQEYNNLNNGEDAGDWAPNCTNPLVQNAEGCPGKANLNISPAAEILVLDVVGFTLQSSSSGPTVTNVTSSTANGTYGVGANISIQITFSAAVTVTGTPQLALNSGGTANYSSGSGTATLTFGYVVGAGQSSPHLDYTSTSALTLNGGTIKNGSNAANLTLPASGAAGSLSANKTIVINTTPAVTITNVTSATPNGTYGVAANISIQVTFSAAVNVTGTPQLALNSGGTANYSSGTGTATLTFTYAVASGQSSVKLDYTSTSALTLNGGTIKDAGSNAANLTLATPGAAGSLSANKSIVIFTVRGISKIGILRSSAFMTAEDVNANITWDPGTDNAFFFGMPGDVLIEGDWDGSGTTKIGIYRPSAAMFAIDFNGNGVWDPGIDKFGFFGTVGDVPLIGDWTGDGKSKIGIYRPSTNLFALDTNNNLAYDAGIDKIGHFGISGDVPILGDWTGDGITKIGIYRPSVSLFAEDVNNNLTWDQGIDKSGVFGIPTDTPIIGDWTGDGISKVGIYRSSASLWALDINNNLAWDAGIDKAGVFGEPGDKWVVGDWDGSGVTRVGIFRQSVALWGLDLNGNLAWDAGIDLSGVFGASTDTPVIGKWPY